MFFGRIFVPNFFFAGLVLRLKGFLFLFCIFVFLLSFLRVGNFIGVFSYLIENFAVYYRVCMCINNVWYKYFYFMVNLRMCIFVFAHD